MNKTRKIITFISMAFVLFEIIVMTTYAWFYFPNAKGLEMDSTPSADLLVSLYKSNGTNFVKQNPSSYRLATSNDFSNNDFISGLTYYTLTPTESASYNNANTYYVKSATAYTNIGQVNEDTYNSYDKLYTISATLATTYNSGTTYYIPAYSIEEKYEFFQWGDEYICEDLDSTHYYALECICPSSAYTDGYIKSVLNMNLSCLGAFEYGTGEAAIQSASIPVFEASYKYATESTIDLTSATALSEAKSNSSTVSDGRLCTYTKFINGNFYTKSGNNYTEATSYTSNTSYYTMDISEHYIKDAAAWTAGSYSNLYYLNNGTYTLTNSFQAGHTAYYSLTNISESTSVKGFGNGQAFTTIDGITGINSYNINNSIVMDRFYSTNNSEGLATTQYVHASDDTYDTEYVRFVIYIKIEPDEDYISAYMNKNSDKTENATSSEIIVSNSLTLDLTIRSVPKYTTYPEE